MFSVKIIPRTLHFKKPASTSRGTYTTRDVWYIVLVDNDDPEHFGVGECAPLPNLSCDALPDYEKHLAEQAARFANGGRVFDETLLSLPSILFGLETAYLHYNCRSVRFFDNNFTREKAGIPINGLVWMDNRENMLAQIKEKISAGFSCIKLKIGAIDFADELSLIQYIRSEFSPDDITIRVDANGAFSPDDALAKMDALSRYSVHSIEQPIRAGQWEAMAGLCEKTPLPIAFDEELICQNSLKQKTDLLDALKPQYIVLKPSLHGGIRGTQQWIDEAGRRGIGWWLTSALESNVGLNAIAQFCSALRPALPQGLGTGALFTDNIDFPLGVKNGKLCFTPDAEPDLRTYLKF